MMKAVFKLTKVEFDYDRYTKKLHDAILKATIDAAIAFYSAAVPLVPVYTGRARGALDTLARELHIDIPAANPASYSYRRNGKARNLTRPNRYSEGIGRVQWPSALSQRNYTFSFSAQALNATGTDYYRWNDTEVARKGEHGVIVGLNMPTPWQSFATGNEAFQEKLHDSLDTIPKIKDYIVAGEVVSDG